MQKNKLLLIIVLMILLFSLNCINNDKKEKTVVEKNRISDNITISRTILDSLPEKDALAKLKIRLNLTDNQIEEIWPLMKESRLQMQAHFQKYGKDKIKIRQLGIEELEKLDLKIEKIITYDQYLEYQKYKKARTARSKQIMLKQDLDNS